MDAFGDDFTTAPPEEATHEFQDDPAADFLAREQEELGDLGQELGLANGTSPSNEEADFFGVTNEAELVDSMAEMRMHSSPSPQMFLSHPKPKEEPETIRFQMSLINLP